MYLGVPGVLREVPGVPGVPEVPIEVPGIPEVHGTVHLVFLPPRICYIFGGPVEHPVMEVRTTTCHLSPGPSPDSSDSFTWFPHLIPSPGSLTWFLHLTPAQVTPTFLTPIVLATVRQADHLAHQVAAPPHLLTCSPVHLLISSPTHQFTYSPVHLLTC